MPIMPPGELSAGDHHEDHQLTRFRGLVANPLGCVVTMLAHDLQPSPYSQHDFGDAVLDAAEISYPSTATNTIRNKVQRQLTTRLRDSNIFVQEARGHPLREDYKYYTGMLAVHMAQLDLEFHTERVLIAVGRPGSDAAGAATASLDIFRFLDEHPDEALPLKLAVTTLADKHGENRVRLRIRAMMESGVLMPEDNWKKIRLNPNYQLLVDRLIGMLATQPTEPDPPANWQATQQEIRSILDDPSVVRELVGMAKRHNPEDYAYSSPPQKKRSTAKTIRPAKGGQPAIRAGVYPTDWRESGECVTRNANPDDFLIVSRAITASGKKANDVQREYCIRCPVASPCAATALKEFDTEGTVLAALTPVQLVHILDDQRMINLIYDNVKIQD